VFQLLERCYRVLGNILGLLIFLQRLQKNFKGCEIVSEAVKIFQSLECFPRPSGTVLEVLFLKDRRNV